MTHELEKLKINYNKVLESVKEWGAYVEAWEDEVKQIQKEIGELDERIRL